MGIQALRSVAKQRTRLVGQLKKFEQRILDDSAEILELASKIHSYNDVLRAQGIEFDPDIYAPAVIPSARGKYFAQGKLTTLCLATLRTVGRACSTTVMLLNALVPWSRAT